MSGEGDLLARLVVEEPVCRSAEGLDDHCAFCFADALDACRAFECERRAGRCYVAVTTHKFDCPWVEGMRLLGRALGPHNHVEE